MICINTNIVEFQTIAKQSGLSTDYVAAICGDFLEKHGRFPHLDEIPGANSKPYLEKQLNIKQESAEIAKILEMTGVSTLEEAQIKLNQIFSDLEITIVPIADFAKIFINKRPITQPISNITLDKNPFISSYNLFNTIINKLQTHYGIKITAIDSDIINNTDLKNIPGVATARAFIYNNEIYINTELADKDAPIHEMMHILVGGLKTSNPELYYNIMQEMANMEMFEQYKRVYPNRTNEDLAEEMFVEQFSRLVTLQDSQLENLPDNIKYELMYQAYRVLDSILMGETSIKDFSDIETFNSSLIELSKLVNSELDVKKSMIDSSRQHRILSNKKQELLENNELQENCNG